MHVYLVYILVTYRSITSYGFIIEQGFFYVRFQNRY